MDLELTGKVALVTAASRGIGRAVAHRLAAEGATVVLSSRDADALAKAAQGTGHGRLLPHTCDLADEGATEQLVPDIVKTHGRLDILVANTPGPKITSFLDTTTADWSAAYQLLVRPMVQLASGAAHTMAAQRAGSIVFLTSTWVKQPASGSVLSAAMRSLISTLAKQMALELAPDGVRVNQIMPGATATDRMRDIVSAKSATAGTTIDQEIGKVVGGIPLGRWAEPEEIARAVAFLASPASAFTTGTALAVDGGAIRTTV